MLSAGACEVELLPAAREEYPRRAVEQLGLQLGREVRNRWLRSSTPRSKQAQRLPGREMPSPAEIRCEF